VRQRAGRGLDRGSTHAPRRLGGRPTRNPRPMPAVRLMAPAARTAPLTAKAADQRPCGLARLCTVTRRQPRARPRAARPYATTRRSGGASPRWPDGGLPFASSGGARTRPDAGVRARVSNRICPSARLAAWPHGTLPKVGPWGPHGRRRPRPPLAVAARASLATAAGAPRVACG
jgi:hypothetical protein